MARSLLQKIGALIFTLFFFFHLFSYLKDSKYTSTKLDVLNGYWNVHNTDLRIHEWQHPESKVIQDLKKLKDVKTEQSIVYSLNKSCPEHFPDSLRESLSLLLRMKTDGATEKSLHQLGLPYNISSIDDLIVPQYTQNKIQVKIPTIVCAASSNHFAELQALFYHIDTNIRRYFPDIKVVFYNIGLRTSDIKLIKQYGRVEYRLFNFDIYPPHVKVLHLCAWKPIIIQEVLREAGYVFYMDTSIELKGSHLQRYFDLSERTGHVFRYYSKTSGSVAVRTLRPTFKFFNVSPCLFHSLPEIEGGQILIRRDNLVSLIIMRSILACALQRQCIMPPGAERRTTCVGPNKYHLCHRNDQSALGISIYLVYHQLDNVPSFNRTSFDTKRGKKSNYLIDIKNVP